MELPRNAAMPCNLQQEFALHQMVYTAFQAYGRRLEIDYRVTVPKAHTFFKAASSTSKLYPLLPDSQQTDSALVDRFLSLPKLIRQALVDELHPFVYENTDFEKKTAFIEITLSAVSNKHCLVRPYHGQSSKKYTTDFSLRDFIIGLEDLQRLEVNVYGLAFTLGKAYAILHWAAHVNCDDVELVFGSSLVAKEEQYGSDDGSYVQHRRICLYLLDFGKCDEVNMRASQEEVFRAFKGAMVTGDNACFTPNIYRSPQLFESFTESYSTAAKHVLQNQPRSRFDIDQFVKDFREYAEDFH